MTRNTCIQGDYFRLSHQSLLFCCVIALAGCGGDATHTLMTPERAELLENKTKWALSAPEEFSYTFRRSCFCAPAGPWRVFYIDDNFQQWLNLDAEPNEASQAAIPETVGEMFDLLEQAYTHETAEVVVEYNSQYGFPISVNIDWLPGAEDDGVLYEISDFALPDSGAAELYRAHMAWSNFTTSSYSYRLDVACFCTVGGPIDVTIEQGVVTSAVREGGKPLTQEEADRLPLTIDALFQKIIENRRDDANEVRVTFSEDGYPLVIAINEHLRPLDGGITYTVSRFFNN